MQQPKVKIVAQVLNEMGLCREPDTNKLPDGWRQRVEKALAKQGVKCHMTTIYEVRRKEVARLQEEARRVTLPQPARLQPVTVHAPPVTGQFQEAPANNTPAQEPDLTQKSR
jgi:hypothetical protein